MEIEKQETEIFDGADDTAVMEEARAALLQEREENARLREQLNGQNENDGGRDGRGLRWFFGEIWSYPQFRMLAVALVIGAWIVLAWCGMLDGVSALRRWSVNLGLALFGAFLFCKWAESVYRGLGPGQLVLKCMAAIGGLVGVGAAFFGRTEPDSALAAPLAVLMFMALLVMSKATERLARSEFGLVRFVREWF